MSGQQVSSADPGTAELMPDVDGANATRAFGACFSGVVVNVRESAAKSLPNRRRKTPENGGKRRRTAETAGTQHGMHPNTLRSCNSHDFATRNVGSGDAPWIPNLDYRKLYTTGAVLIRAEGVSIASDLFAEHGGHSYVVPIAPSVAARNYFSVRTHTLRKVPGSVSTSDPPAAQKSLCHFRRRRLNE